MHAKMVLKPHDWARNEEMISSVFDKIKIKIAKIFVPLTAIYANN